MKNLTTAFIMQGDNLPRDDRKVLLSGCHSIPADCIGDVTGIAGEGLLGPTLENPSINWTTKPGV
jgi:hypothetical protein